MVRRQSKAKQSMSLAVLLLSMSWNTGSPSAADVASPPPEVSRLSPRLLHLIEGAGSGMSVPVVVTTLAPISDADEAEARGAGAVLHRRFGKLSGYGATVSVGSLRRLASMNGVQSISYDAEVAGANDLNYVTVGADIASREFSPFGLDGRGVTVAVVDSGVAAHPDLNGRLVAEVEIVGHEKGFADPYGHGTHVAGIIAGDGSASGDSKSFRRFNGIAPAARIVSVRVLDKQGGGRVSDVLAGIDWVLAHHDEYGIRIMNLSLGHPVEESAASDPLCRAVESAWKAGIFVVAAAGNAGLDGYGSIHSPGNDPLVLTVGASNNYQSSSRSDDILTTYSSKGPTPLDHVVKPDLLAPGNRTLSLRAIGSTLDESYPSLRVKQGAFRDDTAAASEDSVYFQMSGSSMAAGVVSGMAALMLQADASLTPDTLKMRLMRSAEKRLAYDLFAEGAGFADVHAALAETGAAGSPALSPMVSWSASGLGLQDTGNLWSGSEVHDLVSLYGADPLRSTGSVWADSGMWVEASSESTAGVSGNTIIWGGGHKSGSSTSSDTIIWGGGHKSDSSTTADTIIWGGGMKDPKGTTGTSTVGADTIIWGGGMKSPDGVVADTIIWGGGIKGDNNPPM